MSLVSKMRWGVVSKYDSQKGYGFLRSGGERTFFHIKGYRDVKAATDAIQNEPWLTSIRSERAPIEGDVLVFWLDFVDDQDGKAPPASEWSFASVWNPAMVESIDRNKGGWVEEDGPITEDELLKGLEGLSLSEEASSSELSPPSVASVTSEEQPSYFSPSAIFDRLKRLGR